MKETISTKYIWICAVQNPGICGKEGCSASGFMTNCIPYSCAASGATQRAQLKLRNTSVQDLGLRSQAVDQFHYPFFQQKVIPRTKPDRIVGEFEVFIFDKCCPKQQVTDPLQNECSLHLYHIKNVLLMSPFMVSAFPLTIIQLQ